MTQAGAQATNAIELLEHDHDEIRRLLAELEAAPAGGAVQRLVICASRHETLEEQYFWPVTGRRVQDWARLAAQGVRQELELKHILNLVDGLDPADSEFELLVGQLASVCRGHLDFEETRVWPGVRLALSEQELTDLGAQLRQGRKLAPTRPHPHVPPAPEVQRLASRITGATDRIRDALTGRGAT
jgi:hypothetical protein